MKSKIRELHTLRSTKVVVELKRHAFVLVGNKIWSCAKQCGVAGQDRSHHGVFAHIDRVAARKQERAPGSNPGIND